jgi:hypothetical protein
MITNVLPAKILDGTTRHTLTYPDALEWGLVSRMKVKRESAIPRASWTRGYANRHGTSATPPFGHE